DPAGIITAVPTRESIADACAYHELAKLDLATVGSDLTRPLIAAAGRQNGRVCLLDRVANGCKRMPNRCLRCERGDDQNRQQVVHGAPLHLVGKSLPRRWAAHSMRASAQVTAPGAITSMIAAVSSTLSITLSRAQCLSVEQSGGRSISFRKDECHVMHPLLGKISNILVHLKNIHTHTLDRDRFSRPSREEGQLQAESDQDNRNNSDSVMHAHASPPGSRESAGFYEGIIGDDV